MKPLIHAACLFSSLLAATATTSNIIATSPSTSPSESITVTSAETSTPTATYIPATFVPPRTTSPSSPFHIWDSISSAADKVFDEIEDHLHVDLRKRQGGAAITAAPVGAATAATQMSPTTTYFMNSNVNGAEVQASFVYIQSFDGVPDQWDSASAGTIGLGTIQGTVGVLKSNSKRGFEETATNAARSEATPGQILKIKGREVTMS